MDTALTTRSGIDGMAVIPPDRHPALVYLARLAPGSRRSMRGALDTCAKILTSGACDYLSMPWNMLRYQHTAALRATLADRYAPATANKALAALRGVLKEAWRLGYLSAEDFQRTADVSAVRGDSPPAGRALSSRELSAIVDACARDPRASGKRDAAILAVLYQAGLRRSEGVRLDLGDLDPETGALTVRKGKGNKTRIVYVTGGAMRALIAWIERRGTDAGPLFLPVRREGTIVYQRMTDQALMMALRRRAAQAGVAPFTPHDLRRTMISDLLDAGVDLVTIRKLAGHANVTTTAKYDRRGEESKRSAAGLLNIG